MFAKFYERVIESIRQSKFEIMDHPIISVCMYIYGNNLSQPDDCMRRCIRFAKDASNPRYMLRQIRTCVVYLGTLCRKFFKSMLYAIEFRIDEAEHVGEKIRKSKRMYTTE